jgi:hypothetical protein
MNRNSGHRWKQPISRHCHWPYCEDCGLVMLKNDVSRRAASQACPGGQRTRVQVLTSAQIRALPSWKAETTGWKW